ncbi:unnamed protein product [Candidula unifasciata]|uniref:Uncharacterized protein n=1 Tax=Candidula unifasciata TaxID=100452 RepID=A0A8S3ZJK8_9EUPU|nr:unnamed protein product [Candidula unifasciata]
MAAARSPWKRLHTDLEDGDESLPISKRICSLHIESQTQGVCSQSSQGAPPQGLDVAGAAGSSFVANASHQFPSEIPHLVGSCRLESLGEHASVMRTSHHNGHEHNLQTEADQRHAMAGAAAHFSHSLSDPSSSNGVHQHKVDHTFSLDDSRSLLCMPTSHTDPNRVQHNHQVLHHSSNHNDHPAIHSNFRHDIHNGIQNDPAGNPLLQGMPECSHPYHLQQLPSEVYDPELGMEENPFYFSINQMLYEAHLCRLRRGSGFLDNS